MRGRSWERRAARHTSGCGAGKPEFLDQLLARAYRVGGRGTDVALVVDMCIALLERRTILESMHTNSPNEEGPTDADYQLEALARPPRCLLACSSIAWRRGASGGATSCAVAMRGCGRGVVCCGRALDGSQFDADGGGRVAPCGPPHAAAGPAGRGGVAGHAVRAPDAAARAVAPQGNACGVLSILCVCGRRGRVLLCITLLEQARCMGCLRHVHRAVQGRHFFSGGRQVSALLAALVATGAAEAEAAIMEAGAVRTLQALFLQFPFNNMLHHHVAVLIGRGLTQGSDAFVRHLLKCAGPALFTTSAACHRLARMRLGGHVIALHIDVPPAPAPSAATARCSIGFRRRRGR